LVGVHHDPGLLRLPEDLRQPDHRERLRADQVAEDLARPDRGELVHVADQQQVGAGSDGPGELVREDHVDHRRLVDHDQVRVQRVAGVELRVAARLQLQQPVDGRAS
jgi:hypothetical protein